MSYCCYKEYMKIYEFVGYNYYNTLVVLDK